MTSSMVERNSRAPDFRSLRNMVRDEVERMLANPGGRVELALLLPQIEELHREAERAQIVAAQQADRACITMLGAPGATSIGQRAEYRSTAEYLAKTLRITPAEARKRLEVAESILPRQSLTGEPLPPKHPVAARAVESGKLSVATAAQMVHRLKRVAPVARQMPGGGARELEAMESSLVETSLQAGPSTMHKVADVWELRLDQDGKEPSEETKRQLQGLFDGGRKFGLRVFKLYTDDAQAEQLLAACSPAANPRTGSRPSAGAPDAQLTAATPDGEAVPAPKDPRTRPQKLLDGLLGALGIALATNKLPRNGGNRPQLMVTIDYQTLLGQLSDAGIQRSEAVYSGVINPRHIRRLACDADLIPVVLGSAGQVLDAGRAERLFTEEQRKVLYARDGGCTAPGCTIPADGCEAHHVDWWSRGGGTDCSNGALCCPFHHHLVHDGNWEIAMLNGVPFWIPPPYVDPDRRPLRNTYFHPDLGTYVHPDLGRRQLAAPTASLAVARWP